MNKPLHFFYHEFKLFLTALAFLTRFYIKYSNDKEDIQASVRYYPLVGLFIGFLGTSIIVFLSHLAIIPNYILAFFYVFWLYYATKALHWDGLADLSDACGVSTAKFYSVLKDSHIGAFGVLSLIFGILGQILLVYMYLDKTNFSLSSAYFSKAIFILAFMPLWGRVCALLLAFFSKKGFCSKPEANSLGELCVDGISVKNLYFSLILSLLFLAYFASWAMFCVLLINTSVILIKLSKISINNNVFNGDFLGTSIILGELAYLVSLIFV